MSVSRLNSTERLAQGERVRAARELAGKTIQVVAEALGVNKNTIIQWEHGSMPTPENRAKLAELYQVDERILFSELETQLEAARALLRPA